MLIRGCKIRITKSSVLQRQHPEVGSEGFLSSLYLIPKLRLAIGSAFFYKYGKKGDLRCEKKTFGIDLGMSKNIKDELAKKRSRLDVLAMIVEKEIINLFPSSMALKSVSPSIAFTTEPLSFNLTGDPLQLIGEFHLRRLCGPIRSEQQRKSKSIEKKNKKGKPYLPLVDFEIVSDIKAISEAPTKEFQAWFYANQVFVQPLVMGICINQGFGKNIRQLMQIISESRCITSPQSAFKPGLQWQMNSKVNDQIPGMRISIVHALRRLQTIQRVHCERCENRVIDAANESLNLHWHSLINTILGNNSESFTKLDDHYTNDARTAGYFIRRYLARTVLYHNIEYQLDKLDGIQGLVGYNKNELANKVKETSDYIRKEVPKSVAALDRLMKDRGLLQ